MAGLHPVTTLINLHLQEKNGALAGAALKREDG
jgi:hypothetical protein